MEYEDIFNDYTLNIFTDASILQLPGEHIGCPGVILAMTKYGKQYEIPYDYKILRNSTNNESEITAILMGVYAGLKLRNEFRTINLFSDSRICIQGLKYWIFNWVNNIRDNKIISSSHKEVANQQIILQIIYTIIENNLRINLYHQKGHVTLDSDSQENAKKVFKETNFITEDVDSKIISQISIYNNNVDIMTKEILKSIQIQEYTKLKNPIHYVPDKIRINKEYKKLLEPRGLYNPLRVIKEGC